jgi:hypothetical protein
VLAGAVLLVPERLLAQDRVELDPQFLGAAPRALLRARRQEDFDRRLRRDHGADVAALRDPVAALQELALLRDEGAAHLLVRRDLRRGLRHLGVADGLGHVLAVRDHPIAQFELQLLGSLRRRPAVPQQHQRRCPVHSPGIEVGEAERLGHRPRHGALARPGGPVDRHHHVADYRRQEGAVVIRPAGGTPAGGILCGRPHDIQPTRVFRATVLGQRGRRHLR